MKNELNIIRLIITIACTGKSKKKPSINLNARYVIMKTKGIAITPITVLYEKGIFSIFWIIILRAFTGPIISILS
jgi:hypothetical protein